VHGSAAPRAGAEGAEPLRCQGPDDAVGGDAVATLEAAQGAGRASAEATVEPARAVTVPPEQELEDGDVVADRATAKDASAEEGPPERAESAARPLAGEAVDGEPVPALERADSGLGARALYAVDRAAVDPSFAERDLQSRDLRVERARGRGQGERDQNRSSDEAEPGHRTGLFDGPAAFSFPAS
jgi:hypothetical protein